MGLVKLQKSCVVDAGVAVRWDGVLKPWTLARRAACSNSMVLKMDIVAEKYLMLFRCENSSTVLDIALAGLKL